MDTGRKLPLAIVPPLPTLLAASTAETPAKAHSARYPRLLTAEDNDDLREVMQAVLELHGFQVTACIDAEEAEATYVRQQPFDLLVTDLEMPGKSGVDLASNLCGMNPSLPVLIVSGANVNAQQLEEFSARGWNFISKPYAITNLITQIRTLLSVPRSPPSTA